MFLSVFGMLLSIYLLIRVAYLNMYTPDPNRCKLGDSQAVVLWF